MNQTIVAGVVGLERAAVEVDNGSAWAHAHVLRHKRAAAEIDGRIAGVDLAHVDLLAARDRERAVADGQRTGTGPAELEVNVDVDRAAALDELARTAICRADMEVLSVEIQSSALHEHMAVRAIRKADDHCGRRRGRAALLNVITMRCRAACAADDERIRGRAFLVEGAVLHVYRSSCPRRIADEQPVLVRVRAAVDFDQSRRVRRMGNRVRADLLAVSVSIREEITTIDDHAPS